MATTTTNKLPEFATEPQDNTFDEEIIDKSSELEETGFVPNTTIRSSQMNTYMKMMIESLRGIVDGLYRQAAAQGEIKANSTAQEWQNYIQKGLTDLITKTKVNNAVHADEATNVDAITNNDSGNNANVKFTIGDKNFSKTVNNVANANACSGNAASATKLKNARTINISGDATGTAQSFDGTGNVTIPIDVKKSAALDSTNIGDATHPVYFNNEGKPVEVNQKIANDTTGKADTAGTADEAIKLQNSRTISIAGDATGSASFDGSENATITVDVNHAAALDSKNIGSSTNPVYIDANGKPQATGSSLSKSITGNAGTATKLQTPRNIALTGDVVGNANFDGSGNIAIETSTTIANAKSMVTSTGAALNAGGLQKPVYFSNGIPTQVNMFRKVGQYQLTRTSTGKYEKSAIPDTSYFLAFVEIGFETGEVCLSGLAEFGDGIIQGMMSGTFIMNQTGSGSSTAFINTNVFGITYNKTTVVEGQEVMFDGSISANVSYDFIRITKLYQITLSN